MKDSPFVILAIKSIILSIVGLSTLPFFSIVVQYIDSVTGFSFGDGYFSNSMDYIFMSPLIYPGIILCINVIIGIIYLIYSFVQEKRGDH